MGMNLAHFPIFQSLNPLLGDKEVAKNMLSVAKGALEAENYQTATLVASMLGDDPFVGSEAKELIASIPDQARWDAIGKEARKENAGQNLFFRKIFVYFHCFVSSAHNCFFVLILCQF